MAVLAEKIPNRALYVDLALRVRAFMHSHPGERVAVSMCGKYVGGWRDDDDRVGFEPVCRGMHPMTNIPCWRYMSYAGIISWLELK